MLKEALVYLSGGLSVIPIGPEKRPAIPQWGQYQTRVPTAEEAGQWWGRDHPTAGFGAILGPVSGNIYALDFEDRKIFGEFLQMAQHNEALEPLLDAPCVDTPRGNHLYFKFTEEVLQRTIIAKQPNPDYDPNSPPDEKGVKAAPFKTMIEFRGDGGYNLLPGSPGHCHPSGKQYFHTSGGDIWEAPEIDRKTLDELLDVCKYFNTYSEPEKIQGVPKTISEADQRPGTDYCRRGDWSEWTRLLKLAGAEQIHASPKKEIWRRPGKDTGAGSATLGFCEGELGAYLYVFTTNWHPFKSDCCYSLFALRVLVEFNGDWKAAAIKCGAEGFGEPPDDEIKTIVEAEVKEITGDVRADPTAKLIDPEWVKDKLNGYPGLKRIWKMRRERDFAGDHNLYLNSLLIWCVKNLVEAEEVNDPAFRIKMGCRMAYEFLREMNGPVEKALDVEYMARKVTSAYRLRDKEEKVVIQKIQDTESGDTKEKKKAWLRKILKLDFQDFIVSQELGFHWFVMPDGKRVAIGKTEICKVASKFEIALAGHNLQKYGFPGSLDSSVKKGPNWDNVWCQLYAIRIPAQDDDPAREVVDWIERYIVRYRLVSDDDEGGWQSGIGSRCVLRYNGGVWIRLSLLKEHLRVNQGIVISDRELAAKLLQLDSAVFKKTLSGRDKKGGRFQQRYWCIPEHHFALTRSGEISDGEFERMEAEANQ